MAGIGDQIKSAGKSVSKFAQEATSSVTEWWQEVNAVSDRRNEIQDLSRERENLLVEMGTKVYTLHRRDKVQNRDLLSDCERIDDIAGEIERLEEEIAEIRRKKAQAEPKHVELSDESPVVADEDVEVAATEPEVEKEATVPCAHAQDAAEGPADEDEGGARAECAPEEDGPTMEPVPEDTPETDVESAIPEAHSEDATEGPEGEAGAVDTSETEVEDVEPEFAPSPAGDASEPEVESEGAAPCAHAQDAAEGPADEDETSARPGCDE